MNRIFARTLARMVGRCIFPLICSILCVSQAMAGDALFRDAAGVGTGWDPGVPVSVWLFGGDMPQLPHDRIQAEVEGALSMWQSAPRSRLRLRFQGSLPGPLTADEFESAIFVDPQSTDNAGVHKGIVVVPDPDGSILERVGSGLSRQVLGLTWTFKDDSEPYVHLAVIFLNGALMTPALFPRVVRHEMGHALGLAHMEANIDCGQLAPPSDEFGCEDRPLMRRGGLDSGQLAAPAFDDYATLASLYPSTAPEDAIASISGRMTLRSTGMPVAGAVVVARNPLSPRRIAASSVTSIDSVREGRYRIAGLPPGDYEIQVAPILASGGPSDALGDVSSPYPSLRSPSAFFASMSGTETPLADFRIHVDGGRAYTVDLIQDDLHPASPSAPSIRDASAVIRSGVVYAEIEAENPNGEPLVVWEKRLDGTGGNLNPGVWLWDQSSSLDIPHPMLQLTLPPGTAAKLGDTRQLQLYLGGTDWYTRLDNSLPGVAAGDVLSVPIDVEPVVGDVDGDGRLTARDAALSLRYAVGLVPLTVRQQMQADIAPLPGLKGRYYGDGKIDMADVTALLRRLIGLDTGPLIAPGPTAASLRLGPHAAFSPETPPSPEPGLSRKRGGILIP